MARGSSGSSALHVLVGLFHHFMSLFQQSCMSVETITGEKDGMEPQNSLGHLPR